MIFGIWKFRILIELLRYVQTFSNIFKVRSNWLRWQDQEIELSFCSKYISLLLSGLLMIKFRMFDTFLNWCFGSTSCLLEYILDGRLHGMFGYFQKALSMLNNIQLFAKAFLQVCFTLDSMWWSMWSIYFLINLASANVWYQFISMNRKRWPLI